jgi:hypothetical protein
MKNYLFRPDKVDDFLKGDFLDKKIFDDFLTDIKNLDLRRDVCRGKNPKCFVSGVEANVREKIVFKLLKALGFNIDVHTQLEEPVEHGSIDISLRLDREEKAITLVEIKSWLTNLDKRSNTKYSTVTEQGLYYAQKKDITWFFITNGSEFRLYRSRNSMGNPEEYYEGFTLEQLKSFDEFHRFYLLCSYQSFQNKIQEKLYSEEKLHMAGVNESIHDTLNIVRIGLMKSIIKKNKDFFEKIEHRDEVLLQKTQKIIDRLIFIRFAEDNGLLPEPQKDILKAYLSQWIETKHITGISLYDFLKKLFYFIQEGSNAKEEKIFPYNGGLFEHDDVLNSLKIDDEPLESSIKLLYNLNDIYQTRIDFSKIPIDILGHIYERYLLIKLEIGWDKALVKVSQDPSKIRSEGIVYTLEHMTRELTIKGINWSLDSGCSLNELKVIDPACGSGTFLIKAYDHLFKIHSFSKTEKTEKLKELANNGYASLEAHEKLSKGDIMVLNTYLLEKCLFGVDKNEQATEITKLSLWFKTAIKNQRLTDLKHNIQTGNSLVDKKDVVGDLAFNWSKEFNGIKFDVVVGNPPWGADFTEKEKDFLSELYDVPQLNLNSFDVFIRRSLTLLNDKGVLSFLLPRNFIRQVSYGKLRKMLLTDTIILELIDYKKFEGITQECIGLVLSKRKNVTINGILVNNKNFIQQDWLLQLPNSVFNLEITPERLSRINNIFKNKAKLSDYLDLERGEEVSKKGGVIKCSTCGKWRVASKKEKINCPHCKKDILKSNAESASLVLDAPTVNSKPILLGEDIEDFKITPEHHFDLSKEGIELEKPNLYIKDQIVLRAKDGKCAIDPSGYVITKNVYSLRLKKEHKKVGMRQLNPVFFEGILNSELMQFVHDNIFLLGAELTIYMPKEYLDELPFPKIDFSNKNFTKVYDKIVETSEKIRSHKKKPLPETSFNEYYKKYPKSKLTNKLGTLLKGASFKVYTGLDDPNKIGRINSFISELKGEELIVKITYFNKKNELSEEIPVIKAKFNDEDIRDYLHEVLPNHVSVSKKINQILFSVYETRIPALDDNLKINNDKIHRLMTEYKNAKAQYEKLMKQENDLKVELNSFVEEVYTSTVG